MKIIDDLNAVEIRVLGALLEKEQATPEYYPLTVNTLIAACNQKSNRDPVTELTETEVVEALDSMRQNTLVWRSEGARVERWKQSISRRLELDPEEKAVLTLLLLRGPQTVGQLRSRSPRLHAFEQLREVEAALERLSGEGRELVAELPRRPGQKENRWTHRLDDSAERVEQRNPDENGSSRHRSAAVAEPKARDTPDRTVEFEQLEQLEERLARLESRVDELARKIEDGDSS